VIDAFLHKACADKLRMEMEDFGYPPIFREMENMDEPQTPNAESEPLVKDKAKGKKASSCFHLFFICQKQLHLTYDRSVADNLKQILIRF